MKTTQSPELTNMMNAYFHQDYDINGDTDREIVLEYARHRSPDQIASGIAEIDALLVTPAEGLRDRYRQQTGLWNMLVGNDDAATRAWLVETRQILLDCSR